MTSEEIRILKADFEDNSELMDSIYKVINISRFEKRLISTKEILRLKGIKQLGFVHLVFPNAEHSRFSHSIGVCHQAKNLVDQISKNISNSPKYQRWRQEYPNSDFPSKVSDINEITKIERIVISTAALLHDLSHSPFSHEIEILGENSKGIPIHDDFEDNAVFFQYLFNTNKSELANIINIYNASFWQLVKDDKKWWAELQSIKSIDDNGFVIINSIEDNIIENDSDNTDFLKLPVLGVMIFEILLFDKASMWLDLENIDFKESLKPNVDGIKVRVDFEKNKFKWKPILKWFRPYRKDIIANTICADLLDYLLRDGYQTGILTALDLKFFDRIAIAKAVPEKTKTLIPLNNIPDFCEHIVFDIFDHKRKTVRHSIITEILSFLQQRYLLTERVYKHRIVEGAKSMLKEVTRILISNNSIDEEKLHNLYSIADSPISDELFFFWILNLKEENEKGVIDNQTLKAKQLVRMLRDRRIFREAAIIEVSSDLQNGSLRGGNTNYKTLEVALLDDSIRSSIIENINKEITEFCKKNNTANAPNGKNEQLVTIGIEKFGKRYKVPKVLVVRPLNNIVNDIEVLPLFDIEEKKLSSISNRLDAMQQAYNSLWQVYLFIHPFFHNKGFVQLHKNISSLFINLLYKHTKIIWQNTLEAAYEEDLLPKKPNDISTFIAGVKSSELSIEDLENFLKQIIKDVSLLIPEEKRVFKLNSNNLKALIQKTKKGVPEINNKKYQQVILTKLRNLNIEIPIAARNKEETIIDQIIDFFKNTIEEEKSMNDEAD